MNWAWACLNSSMDFSWLSEGGHGDCSVCLSSGTDAGLFVGGIVSG